MCALVINLDKIKSYKELLYNYPLHKINTEEENKYFLLLYTQIIDFYIDNPNLTFFEKYLDKLVILIEEFEEKMYPILIDN